VLQYRLKAQAHLSTQSSNGLDQMLSATSIRIPIPITSRAVAALQTHYRHMNPEIAEAAIAAAPWAAFRGSA